MARDDVGGHVERERLPGCEERRQIDPRAERQDGPRRDDALAVAAVGSRTVGAARSRASVCACAPGGEAAGRDERERPAHAAVGLGPAGVAASELGETCIIQVGRRVHAHEREPVRAHRRGVLLSPVEGEDLERHPITRARVGPVGTDPEDAHGRHLARRMGVLPDPQATNAAAAPREGEQTERANVASALAHPQSSARMPMLGRNGCPLAYVLSV